MEDQDLEQRLLEALEKMESQDPGGDLVMFTAQQAEALVQVAAWWVALKGAGKLGAALGSGLKWLAVFIAAWVALKAGFLEWIISSTGAHK